MVVAGVELEESFVCVVQTFAEGVKLRKENTVLVRTVGLIRTFEIGECPDN